MIPLCIAAIEDDHDRFFMEQLYYKYQRLMYSVIQRYTRDPWDADDIFQSTLPKLIDKLALLKTLKRSKLTNYIISTCKNTAFNYLNVPIWTIASLGEKMSLVDTSPTPARMLSGQVMIPVYSEQEDTGWNSQYENNMLTLLLPEPATLPIS